jgi:hypothetical protein
MVADHLQVEVEALMVADHLQVEVEAFPLEVMVGQALVHDLVEVAEVALMADHVSAVKLEAEVQKVHAWIFQDSLTKL